MSGRRNLIALAALFVAALGVGSPGDGAVRAAGPPSSPTSTNSFVPLDPARVLGAAAPVTLVAGRTQTLTVAGRHGAPPTVAAARFVVTVAPSVAGLELRVHASGSPTPLVPTVVAAAVGEPVIRTVTVAVGASGQVDFRPTGSGVMTVDLVGVYSPATSATSGRFVPVDPLFLAEKADSRVVDIVLPTSVPSDAAAVVLHVTAWNAATVGTWSVGGSPAVVAVPGRVSSNEVAVRPVSGRLRFSGSSNSRLAIDMVGWFTGPSSTSSSDGLFVVASPTRLVDTSSGPNPLGANVALHARWSLETPLAAAIAAQAAVIRVGVAGAHGAGSLSVYAAGRARPNHGQVHVASPGASAAAEVTTRVSRRGVAAQASGGADVTVDVVGVYSGAAPASTAPKPVNVFPAAEPFPGSLSIPRIKLTTRVLDDTDLVDVDPAHLPESRTPNQPGNTAIFGHRTSKGREFRNIDRLRVGDPIYLAVQGKVYVYAATGVAILDPNDPRLYASSSNDQTLTLVACHPPGSVKQRVVVFARLVSVTSF